MSGLLKIMGSSTAYSGTGDCKGEVYGDAWGEFDFELGLEVLLLEALSLLVVFLDLDRTMQS
jgi:hypothetical protein